MKKNTLIFVFIFSLIKLLQAQDTLYIYKQGNIIYQNAVSEIDSIIFYRPVPVLSCGDPFTDTRDGNIYTTVLIDKKCWMGSNLKYLPSVSPSSAGSNTQAHYYVYGYQGTDVNTAKAHINYNVFGVLYNWAAVMNGENSSSANPSGVRGICPEGWHVPSDSEFIELEIFLGMPQTDVNLFGWRGTTEGGKLKQTGTTYWNSPNTGATNSTGFSALAAGSRNSTGVFYNNLNYWISWTATENGQSAAYNRELGYNESRIFRNNTFTKLHGYSLRCVKD